jgi:hypothetical protein
MTTLFEPLRDPFSSLSRLVLVGVLAIHLVLTWLHLQANDPADLFIYRAGADVALHGESPYNTQRIQARVAAHFPPKLETDLAHNCGFFLAPQAILVFGPFIAVPWEVAEIVWSMVLTIGGFACVRLAWAFGRKRELQGAYSPLIVAGLMLNPITQPAIVVGQTALFVAGCVTLGQLALERGHRFLGVLCWSLIAFKPHLALPLLVAATFIHGWLRGIQLGLMILVLNIVACLISTGSLSLLTEYATYLAEGHKTVMYNQVELNPQITSWNRAFYVLTGVGVNLNAILTLFGLAFWGTLIGVASWVWRSPSPRGMMALGAIASVLCCQVLAYELVLLVLAVPFIFELFDTRRRGEGWLLVLLFVILCVPREMIEPLGEIAVSHRSFTVLILAGAILFMSCVGSSRPQTPVSVDGDGRQKGPST